MPDDDIKPVSIISRQESLLMNVGKLCLLNKPSSKKPGEAPANTNGKVNPGRVILCGTVPVTIGLSWAANGAGQNSGLKQST